MDIIDIVDIVLQSFNKGLEEGRLKGIQKETNEENRRRPSREKDLLRHYRKRLEKEIKKIDDTRKNYREVILRLVDDDDL